MLNKLESIVLHAVVDRKDLNKDFHGICNALNNHNFAATAIDYAKHYIRSKRKPISFK